MRALWVGIATLGLAACSVDSDGFPNVMSGGADASASATATDGGGADTAGDATAGGATMGMVDDTGATAAPMDGTTAGGATMGMTATDDTGMTMGMTMGMTATDDTGMTMGRTDGMEDSGTTGAGACGGTPLDPQLAVPPLCAPVCTNIGFGTECNLGLCRLKDSQTAVCESCDACGNLNALCTESVDCDILFTCFMGRCTAMCDFDTPQTCGVPTDCTDVGHPTHGVCLPF